MQDTVVKYHFLWFFAGFFPEIPEIFSSESKVMKDGGDETSHFFNKSYDLFSTKTNGDEQILRPNDLLSFARQIVLGMVSYYIRVGIKYILINKFTFFSYEYH